MVCRCDCGCIQQTLTSKDRFCYECTEFNNMENDPDNIQKQKRNEHFNNGEKNMRKGFSDTIKRKILKKQNLNCAICKKLLSTHDFDHIDGNSSNDDEDNCQALCPNCHALKTRGLS
jgi:hypothetical protein